MERNIPLLVAQLTLHEKAALCSGLDFWHTVPIPRLGIPSVMLADGPHGLRKQNAQADHLGVNESIQAVCFPAACAAAASFDVSVPRRIGAALGEECRAEDVAVLLGPSMNIKRSPLCGRNFEYFSEDPYLTGQMACAQIEGVQSWDVGACPKHFAANNQEYRRMTGSSQLDRQTLREIYLSGFETAVKQAHPWAMMCAYNRVNGVFASENSLLLNDILREEWGFDGFVVSDWGAVNDRARALEAGLELEMPSSGGAGTEAILNAVHAGSLSEETLDRAVSRILNIVFRYADMRHPEARFDREAHHALAAELATHSAVLLKNERQVLPLTRGPGIAYIGGFAQRPRYQGGGSSHINPYRVSSALQFAPDTVVYEEGFPSDRDESDPERFARAVTAAQQARVAVVFAGLPESFECEGYDRSHMRLPACQNELIARIAAVQKNTVVVLHNGSPVELPWADDVAAILEMYLAGEGVGEATDALLYGDASPSGRLAESFPLLLEHNPSYLTFGGDGSQVPYAEGVFVGYRYYETKSLPVRYAFGHGLSYTSFAYENLTLSSPFTGPGQTLAVRVDVINTGSRSGEEVIQLYLASPFLEGTVRRPLRQLKGFAKLFLRPGERKAAVFELDTRAFQYYHAGLNGWYAPSGEYQVQIARSAAQVELCAPVRFESGQALPLTVDANTPMGLLLQHPALAALVQQPARILGAPAGEAGTAAAEAITGEMVRKMMEDSPLRLLRNFHGMAQKELDELVRRLAGTAQGEAAHE